MGEYIIQNKGGANMEDINKSYAEELAELDSKLSEKQEALELEYQEMRNMIIEKYEKLRKSALTR